MKAESVGERIARLRKFRRLSLASLEGPGLSKGFLGRIERGERQPSVETLRLLAPKLGVTPEYLETGERLVVLRLRARDAQGLVDGAELPKTALRDAREQLAALSS